MKKKMDTPSDSLTLLVCSPRFSASKSIHRDANGSVVIKGFHAGKYFGVIERTVLDIEDLSKNLTALETTPNIFVIRGALVSGQAPERVQRTKANFVTPATGKRWVMLDIDKLPYSLDVDIKVDPVTVMDHLISQLPIEFHDTSYHYQLSSSSGFTASNTVSAHLWFWLSSPRTDAELKRWAKTINQSQRLVDPALFNDVQAHFTAAPKFIGLEDPIPLRSGLVHKKRANVEIQIPEIPLRPHFTQSIIESKETVGFESHLSKIGDHPGGGGFHVPIISAIASFVSENGNENIDPDQLYTIIHDRVIKADRSKHDDAYVERMAERTHIMPAIEGAMRKFGDRPATRRRSRLIKDISPPNRPPVLKGAEGHKVLSTLLDGIIGGKQS